MKPEQRQVRLPPLVSDSSQGASGLEASCQNTPNPPSLVISFLPKKNLFSAGSTSVISHLDGPRGGMPLLLNNSAPLK